MTLRMGGRMGGLRDPVIQQELITLDREPKRNALRGNWLPLGIFPAARIVQTTLQNIGGAWATVTMDATTFDNDGIASLGTDQIIVKFPGLYALWGHINWAAVASVAGDTRFARFLVNGVAMGESGGWQAATGQQVRVNCQEVVSLARGGTIALQGFSVPAVNTFVTNNAPSLSVAWIGVPL